ncbi:MAG: DNA topoisomerase I, partial [Tannerella sp.]|nr:DNA topoisomerase I [Tannerella sp.]
EKTTITIALDNHKEKFVATGEVITFNGFLLVYMESQDDDNEKEQENGILPVVQPDEKLLLQEMAATERFTQRPQRYTEASLVRRLEELGIGRPSTYAPTIQTIQNREYVLRGDKPGEERNYHVLTLAEGKITKCQKKDIIGADRNKLIPTDIGTVVNDFLMENFPDILDYNFTANVEKDFDAIAEGQLVWTTALDKFYKLFHPIVEAASAVKTERKVGERKVGVDPKSGEPIYVKIGRFGPIAQIGEARANDKDGPKPRFATLLKTQSIETITLEEVLKLFDLPRTIGKFEGKEMTVGVGRFGPFVKHNDEYISIPKQFNPLTIKDKEAIKLIEEKRARLNQKMIKTFDEDPELKILNGRYGAYISYNGANYRIPKNRVPAELSMQDCLDIISKEKK